jgi:colicin import membrane protein
LQSAQARTRAAQARARAADAQSDAEYRAQQQLASAADAEADAADAEATAKEAAMMTAEAQYLPGQADNSSDTDDQSGDDVAVGPGKNIVKPVITPLPPTLSPKDAELERLMQKATKKSQADLKSARRQIVAKKNPQAARILAASETDTPAGMKLQAAIKLYNDGKRGDPKARRAIANMVAKAKKGDKQALADVYAMKAAQVAVKSDTAAAKHVARVAAYRAQTAKVVAVRKRIEVATANKLTQASRAHGLAVVAKNERKAAMGDKKAQAIIAKHVALAKAGNKQSGNFVKATVLAKHVRTTAPTRAERQRVAQARRMASKIAKGDKKAIRNYRVMAAAAKGGNPNAKRGMARLQTGAAIDRTIKTGMVVLPAVVITAEVVKKQEAKKAADQKKLASVEVKVAKGAASKEEVQAAAKIAANEGDHEKAKELMTVAASTPSAKDELARVASVVAASEAGNPKSQQSVATALKAAEAGAPEGIEAAGKIAAVQALHQVSADKPIAPEMKTAVADLEAAQAGDPATQKKLEVMKEQASFKIPEAVKYMTYATGAAVVGRALADNPVAHDEWLQKAGVKPEDSSTKNTEVETEKGAAFYKADEPLPPVRSTWDMLKASLAALFLATPDPFQNYREGVQARAHRALGPVTSTGEDDTKDAKPTRKDPEEKYRVHAPKDPDEKYMVHGDDKTAPDPKLVELTKRRLGDIKAAADKGDADAKKKWATSNTNYTNKKALAAKGDPKATAIVAVLEATGLFKS